MVIFALLCMWTEFTKNVLILQDLFCGFIVLLFFKVIQISVVLAKQFTDTVSCTYRKQMLKRQTIKLEEKLHITRLKIVIMIQKTDFNLILQL